MGIKSLSTGYLMFPTPWGAVRSNTRVSTNPNASGEEVGFIFQAPKSGIITDIYFGISAITTAGSLDVRIETVLNGQPTGTLWGTNTNAVQTITTTGYYLTKLTAGAVVNRGDFLAIVIEWVSGDHEIIRHITSSGAMWNGTMLPYGFSTEFGKSNVPLINVGILYSDNTTAPCGVLCANLSNLDITTDFHLHSSPDERGNVFRFPFPVSVAGVWFCGTNGGDFQLILYDDANSILASITQDKDHDLGAFDIHYQLFASSVTLQTNRQYRLIAKPTTSTTIGLTEVTVDHAVLMQHYDGGSDVVLTTRTDGGAWTETPTARGMVGFLIDGMEDEPQIGSIRFSEETVV